MIFVLVVVLILVVIYTRKDELHRKPKRR
jgi:hypothetical protein